MCRCVAAEKKISDLPHFLGGFKAALKFFFFKYEY